MRSIKISFWTCLFTIIIMQGCGVGKYDDGPFLSFYSDQTRVIKEWKLKKFLINGADSTADYECGACTFFLKIDKSNVLLANYMVNGQVQTVSKGTWNFADHDKNISFITSENIIAGPVMNGEAWNITKSSKKQLWISHYSKNGKLYEIQME